MDKSQQTWLQLMQIFIAILVFCLGGIVVANEFFDTKIVPIQIHSQEKWQTLPAPVLKATTEQKDTPVKEKPLPKSVNLHVPFYMQAPDNKRVLPWTEACSEANIVLAAYYIQDKILTKDEFKQQILMITKVQKKLFGTYIETPLEELKKTYDRFYPNIGHTKIIENPTILDIKKELAQWNIIISPSAGKKLDNKYYSDGGPRFHTLLIRGYDNKYFYTNDVGISRGEKFPYLKQTIIDANHDLVEGDITQWPKRMLVIEK